MNRIKELRKEKKLTQKELSNEIAIPYRTIQRWENEETIIKADKAQLLANFFGVSIPYLLGYNEQQEELFNITNSLTKMLDDYSENFKKENQHFEELALNADSVNLNDAFSKLKEFSNISSQFLTYQHILHQVQIVLKNKSVLSNEEMVNTENLITDLKKQSDQLNQFAMRFQIILEENNSKNN